MNSLKKGWFCKLLVAFVLSISITGMSYAAEANLADISISTTYGEVKESFKGTSGKAVIHIQDAHCNYDAQVSISNIIKQLVAENKFDLVALEGAKGIVDTALLKAIPDERVKDLVVDYLVRQGDVNGADLASITADQDFTLWGVENKNLYFKNRDSFLASLEFRADLDEKVSKIRWLLSQLKEKTFSGEAKDLFANIDDYSKDRISLSRYCVYLKEVSDKKSVNWKRYENYSQIIEIVSLEDSIDFSQIETERLSVVEGLEKVLKKDAVSELVSQSLYFRLGKISAKKYYNYLNKLAKDNNVDLNKEANLNTYVKLVNLYDEVNSDKLFFEIEQLEGDVKNKVYKTNEEKELDTYFKNINVLGNLCSLKMTRKDLTYFGDNKKSFKIDKFVSFIRKEMVKHNLSFPIDDDLKVIEQVMPELESFYNLATKRDEVMVDNLISKMEKSNREKAILVTGGFHSQGILERLKAKDISYIVVMPKINSIANTEEVYLKRMTEGMYGTAGIGFGTLSPIDNFSTELADAAQQAAFSRNVGKITAVAGAKITEKQGVMDLSKEFVDAYAAEKERVIRKAIADGDIAPMDEAEINEAVAGAVADVTPEVLSDAVFYGDSAYVAVKEKNEQNQDVVNLYKATLSGNTLAFNLANGENINTIKGEIRATNREQLEMAKPVLDKLNAALTANKGVQNVAALEKLVNLFTQETFTSAAIPLNSDEVLEVLEGLKLTENAARSTQYSLADNLRITIGNMITDMLVSLGIQKEAEAEKEDIQADPINQLLVNVSNLTKSAVSDQAAPAVVALRTVNENVDGVIALKGDSLEVTVAGETRGVDGFRQVTDDGVEVFVSKNLMDKALQGDTSALAALSRIVMEETIEQAGFDHQRARDEVAQLDDSIQDTARKAASAINIAQYQATDNRDALVAMLTNALQAGETLTEDAVVSKLLGGTDAMVGEQELGDGTKADAQKAAKDTVERALKEKGILAADESVQDLLKQAAAAVGLPAADVVQTPVNEAAIANAADDIIAAAKVKDILDAAGDAVKAPKVISFSLAAALNMRVENGKLTYTDPALIVKALDGYIKEAKKANVDVTADIYYSKQAIATMLKADASEVDAVFEKVKGLIVDKLEGVKGVNLVSIEATDQTDFVQKMTAEMGTKDVSHSLSNITKAEAGLLGDQAKSFFFERRTNYLDNASVLGMFAYFTNALVAADLDTFKEERLAFIESIIDRVCGTDREVANKLKQDLRAAKDAVVYITHFPIVGLQRDTLNVINITERTVELYA